MRCYNTNDVQDKRRTVIRVLMVWINMECRSIATFLRANHAFSFTHRCSRNVGKRKDLHICGGDETLLVRVEKKCTTGPQEITRKHTGYPQGVMKMTTAPWWEPLSGTIQRNRSAAELDLPPKLIDLSAEGEVCFDVVFDGLVGMNDGAVVASAKMEPDGLQR